MKVGLNICKQVLIILNEHILNLFAQQIFRYRRILQLVLPIHYFLCALIMPIGSVSYHYQVGTVDGIATRIKKLDNAFKNGLQIFMRHMLQNGDPEERRVGKEC